VPANLQRFLPLLLIVFVLLFIVPAILHKSSSSGSLTASELSTQTIGAMSIVDRTEGAFRTAHRNYSPHVADLLTLDHALGTALGDGVVVSLDVSSNGQTYYAEVASGVIGLVQSRTAGKLILKHCLVIKSSSGVACPSAKTATAARTATTTTTSTSG
jgi:hypothetical protein